MSSIQIRDARAGDVSTILRFIQALAHYERLADQCFATEELLSEKLFGERKYAEVLIAEVDEKPVGFALYFHNFSTFLATPGLYLEDLFVDPSYRGFGIGKALLKRLAEIAVERGCGRMEWWVLDWNEDAIRFYESLGAEAMSEWTVFRLNDAALNSLANS